jgi:hypothetical protein
MPVMSKPLYRTEPQRGPDYDEIEGIVAALQHRMSKRDLMQLCHDYERWAEDEDRVMERLIHELKYNE